MWKNGRSSGYRDNWGSDHKELHILPRNMSFIERQWRTVDIIGKVTSYLQFEKFSSREENTL